MCLGLNISKYRKKILVNKKDTVWKSYQVYFCDMDTEVTFPKLVCLLRPIIKVVAVSQIRKISP